MFYLSKEDVSAASKSEYLTKVQDFKISTQIKLQVLTKDDLEKEYIKFLEIQATQEEAVADKVCFFLCLEELFDAEFKRRKLSKVEPSSPDSSVQTKIKKEMIDIFSLSDKDLKKKYMSLLRVKSDYLKQTKLGTFLDETLSQKVYNQACFFLPVVKEELKARGIIVDEQASSTGVEDTPLLKVSF
jgi:hypothetical protein